MMTINKMNELRYQLEQSHKDLYQWFLLQQECLLLNEDELAIQALDAFAAYLTRHIEFENCYVLDEGSARVDDMRWPLMLYQKEHEKLLIMLNNIRGDVQSYMQLQGRQKRLALLEVLANQQTFRNVVEHHELREEQDLFIHLGANEAGIEAWPEWLDKLHKQFQPLKAALKAHLSSC